MLAKPNKTMLLKVNCWAKTRPSVAFSKLQRLCAKKTMYAPKLKEWLISNGTEDYLSSVRNNNAETREHLKILFVEEDSELGKFYLNYGSYCVRGWYELNEIEEIGNWTEYARDELGVSSEFLALTSIEGQGITLLNRNTGEVYDIEYGQFEDLKEGKIEPIATSFNGFLEWCMEKSEKST